MERTELFAFIKKRKTALIGSVGKEGQTVVRGPFFYH